MSPPSHATSETQESQRPPLGVRLREQRRALGLSLDEASTRSGVRADYLSALERHDLEALPTVGYGLGYVRAYARALGLNEAASVADFKRDSAVPKNLFRRDTPHFVPTRQVRLPRGAVPALGVIAAVVMLGAWYGVQLDTVAAPSSVVSAPFDPDATQPAAPVPDTILTLRTTAPSWVTIRDPRGRLVANRVFVTGESWQMEVGRNYSVDVRDGGAVEILIGERLRGLIGEPGEPVRGLDLSAIR
ncbi:MAG: RodZ domain-containing protein [Pseudomonadota bacterium]